MDGLKSVVLACVCFTAAAVSSLPLILISPLIVLRGWKLLLSVWGLWGFLFGQGLCFLWDTVTSIRDVAFRPRQRPHSTTTTTLQTVGDGNAVSPPPRSRRESNADVQSRHIRHDMTPPSTLARTSSVKFATASSQQPSLPASRRASSTLDSEEALHMARAVRESARDDNYMYDLPTEGASRLSSRRSSRAASAADLKVPELRIDSGSATPRKAPSRAESFTVTANAFPSRNTSTSSLANVPESTRQHKRTKTGG